MSDQEQKPNSESETARELKGELGDKISLQVLHDSPGGKLLIDGLVADILGALDALAANAQALTLQEFVALGCKLKERLDILKILTGAKAAKDEYRTLLDEELKREAEIKKQGGE